MSWLALLRPLAALLEKLLAFALLWRATKAGRNEAELAHQRETSRKALAAARARADFRRAADDGRLHDDDGFRRD